MSTHKIFNLIMALIFAVSLSGTPVPAFAQEHSPNIQVWVTQGGRSIDGETWPENDLISLTIEDPATPASPDFTAEQPTSPCWWDADQGCVHIPMGDFQYAVGQIITMSDGSYTKIYTITSLNLKITEIDMATDVVSGTADPNSSLHVGNGQGYPSRFVTANSSGVWSANFAIAGDGEETLDIIQGTGVGISQNDNDGDGISDYATAPYPPVIPIIPPSITAFPHYYTGTVSSNKVSGNDWEPDTTVTLSIDDPTNGVGWDYTDSQVVPSSPSSSDCYAASQLCFNIDPYLFQLQPGHVVRLSDGTVTKVHVVTNLRILEMNSDSDTVSGTADAGSQITIWTSHQNIQSRMRRIVTANEAGNWIADFSVPGNGDNELIFDLQTNDRINLSQSDQDGNTTRIWWRQPKPAILSQSDFDSILGSKWPAGNIVTLIVDDTPTPILPYLYTGSQTVGSNFNVVFDVGSAIDLLPGQYVTLSDGVTTKSMQIADVHFDSIDETTNTAAGRGPHDIAEAWCYVPTINDDYCEITLGSDDHWTASFAGVLDLQNIQEASAHFIDIDGDTTVAFLASNQPQLTALSPAKVWVGLKNSDDVGTKFDLLAEVYQNNTLVGSGQLDKVNGGSSGFNNAKLNTIPLTLFAPIDWPQDGNLSLKVYVRNTCFGNTHNSGTARLWYNDASADSQFGATIDNLSQDYFLKDGFTLSLTPGSGPRKTIDVAAGKPCSPYKLFGTWSIVP